MTAHNVGYQRAVTVQKHRTGWAIYVDNKFVSDHYTQDSLAAAHKNILIAEGWAS